MIDQIGTGRTFDDGHLPTKYTFGKGEEKLGNRQFVVADPDGYLLRSYQSLGCQLR